jgi:tRNA(fMet)-specific endonuclease VapC
LVTLSLDTNVLIELINGKNRALREHYDAALMSGRPITISVLVMHELIYGALISERPDHHMALAQSFAVEHEVVDWAHADALAAARVRAGLKLAGQRIGSFDTLLAGQALNRGWTLITANTREFGRVRDLEIEDWSRS